MPASFGSAREKPLLTIPSTTSLAAKPCAIGFRCKDQSRARAPSSVCLGLGDERLRSLRGEERRRFFRARLYERDKGMCGICGQPVEITG